MGMYKQMMEQTIGRAGSKCVGCDGVGASDTIAETGLAELTDR